VKTVGYLSFKTNYPFSKVETQESQIMGNQKLRILFVVDRLQTSISKIKFYVEKIKPYLIE